jgi:hypothetical protein
MVRLTLKLFEASAAPDEGSKKRKYKWRNKNMERRKGMQLGAMLAAMLLVSMAFVPAAMAKKDEGTSKLSDPAVVKALVEKISKEGANADKLFAKLSPQQQATVIEALKVKEVKVNISMNQEGVSIATTCNSPRVEVDAYSVIGIKLWGYFQQIDRCYDGSKITSESRLRWGEVYFPFWSFTGHIGDTQAGGVGQSYYRAWTQGQFKFCVGGTYGCIQERDPWIDQIVYGDGNYWRNYSG